MLERGSARAVAIGHWGMALTLVIAAVLIGRLIRAYPFVLPNPLPGLVVYELGPGLILAAAMGAAIIITRDSSALSARARLAFMPRRVRDGRYRAGRGVQRRASRAMAMIAPSRFLVVEGPIDRILGSHRTTDVSITEHTSSRPGTGGAAHHSETHTFVNTAREFAMLLEVKGRTLKLVSDDYIAAARRRRRARAL